MKFQLNRFGFIFIGAILLLGVAWVFIYKALSVPKKSFETFQKSNSLVALNIEQASKNLFGELEIYGLKIGTEKDFSKGKIFLKSNYARLTRNWFNRPVLIIEAPKFELEVRSGKISELLINQLSLWLESLPFDVQVHDGSATLKLRWDHYQKQLIEISSLNLNFSPRGEKTNLLSASWNSKSTGEGKLLLFDKSSYSLIVEKLELGSFEWIFSLDESSEYRLLKGFANIYVHGNFKIDSEKPFVSAKGYAIINDLSLQYQKFDHPSTNARFNFEIKFSENSIYKATGRINKSIFTTLVGIENKEISQLELAYFGRQKAYFPIFYGLSGIDALKVAYHKTLQKNTTTPKFEVLAIAKNAFSRTPAGSIHYQNLKLDIHEEKSNISGKLGFNQSNVFLKISGSVKPTYKKFRKIKFPLFRGFVGKKFEKILAFDTQFSGDCIVNSFHWKDWRVAWDLIQKKWKLTVLKNLNRNYQISRVRDRKWFIRFFESTDQSLNCFYRQDENTESPFLTLKINNKRASLNWTVPQIDGQALISYTTNTPRINWDLKFEKFTPPFWLQDELYGGLLHKFTSITGTMQGNTFGEVLADQYKNLILHNNYTIENPEWIPKTMPPKWKFAQIRSKKQGKRGKIISLKGQTRRKNVSGSGEWRNSNLIPNWKIKVKTTRFSPSHSKRKKLASP